MRLSLLRSPLPGAKLPILPERRFTWGQWQAGCAERRRLGNLVTPAEIHRKESSDDKSPRETFDDERGPAFGKELD